MAQRRVIFFGGRVQGIGFRATTVHLAKNFSLGGTVENLEDGRVKLVLEGEAVEIDGLIERIREHFGGFVRTVDQEIVPALVGQSPGHRGGGVRIVG